MKNSTNDPTCRTSDLTVTRQADDTDRSLGYAETTHRLTGIMAGGWGQNLEYLRGVEGKLADTLNRVREAIGHAETVKHQRDKDKVEIETGRLGAEMKALPAYRGWSFTYEYPGYFCYSHSDVPFSVFFTPDYEGEETLPIEVQTDDGQTCDEHSTRLPLPSTGRTGQQIFELVRATLDKLSQHEAPVVCVRLTKADVEVLKKACQHVRVHMAHEHGWNVRDAAMEALGKVIAAASKVPL